MDFKDLVGKISSAAPILGSLVGGPIGGAAGTAIKLIASAFGCNETPEDIDKAISTDPNALLKLKELELNNQLELQKLLITSEQLRLADIDSARRRQTDSEKATGKRDYNMYFLAWFGVLGYLAMISYILIYGLPKMDQSTAFLIGNLIGVVASNYSNIYGFFFGGSKGSDTKTDIMSKLLDKKE